MEEGPKAARFDRLGAPRRVRWIALLLAAVLGLPSLFVGRFAEDIAQGLAAEGMRSPFLFGFSRGDSFVFADGKPESLRPIRAVGAGPFWAVDDFKVAFWRPLSSALIAADVALFGRAAWPAHLHSLLWTLALVAAAGWLYSRLFPSALGAVALLLFALDDARAIPTLWLANRNALVGGTLAVIALALHLRGREKADLRAELLAVPVFATALLAGEITLGFAAYFAAYQLLAAPGTPRRRMLALAPYVGVLVAWAIAFKLQGYGAAGTTLYVDPVSQPVAWLLNLPRLLLLWASLLVGYPADLWAAAAARPVLYAVSALSLLGIGLGLRRVWPSLELEERRHLRWLLAGALVALIPVTSTHPSIRLLAAGGLGGAAVVSALLRLLPRTALARGAVGVLILFHVVLPPLVWAGFTFAVSQGAARVEAVQASLEQAVEPGQAASQVWVLVWGDPFSSMTTSARWLASGQPAPRAIHTLAIGRDPHLLRRVDASTLELQREDGGALLESDLEVFCRPPGSPSFEGIALEGMTVSVPERDPRGGITRLRFTFDRPLDDPSVKLFELSPAGLIARKLESGSVLTVSPAAPF